MNSDLDLSPFELRQQDEMLESQHKIHDLAAREKQRSATTTEPPGGGIAAALQRMWDAASKDPPRTITPPLGEGNLAIPAGYGGPPEASLTLQERAAREREHFDFRAEQMRKEWAEEAKRAHIAKPGEYDDELADAVATLAIYEQEVVGLALRRVPLCDAHQGAIDEVARAKQAITDLRAARAAAIEQRATTGDNSPIEPGEEWIMVAVRRGVLAKAEATRAAVPLAELDAEILAAKKQTIDSRYHVTRLRVLVAAAVEVRRLETTLGPLFREMHSASQWDEETGHQPVSSTGLRELKFIKLKILRSMPNLVTDIDVSRAIGRG